MSDSWIVGLLALFIVTCLGVLIGCACASAGAKADAHADACLREIQADEARRFGEKVRESCRREG